MDKIEFTRKEVEELVKALGEFPFNKVLPLIQFLDQKLSQKQQPINKPEKAPMPNG